jgi:hypothetical protein
MSIWDLVNGQHAPTSLRLEQARSKRAVLSAAALARAWPLALGTTIATVVFARARMIWAPEGDSALHYKLITDIARTHQLPTSLPHYAARLAPGGVIEETFPYSYTPLFHLTGALAYLVDGRNGVLLIGAVAAAAIAIVMYAFLSRRLPWYVASSCVIAAFLPPTTLGLFTHVYMEPMMLALVFGGAWFYYLALTTRRPRPAITAGLLLGLAVGTRQVALIYLFVIGVVTLLYLADRKCWQMPRLKRELAWLVCVVGAFVIVAAPCLAYLAIVNGTIGYADLVIPGTSPSIPVDPASNAYIANITKPHLSLIEWISRYRFTLLYSERWLPAWYAALPFLFFIPGITHLANRGGSARFYARLATVQVVTEMALFALVHGNDRYVIASRLLFYSVLPVGIYAIARTVSLWCRGRVPIPNLIGLATGAVLASVLGSSLVGAAYANYVTDSQDLMSFRSRSYQEMGEWVNANTPADSIILVPRVYSAELNWDRNVTWITFYGNAWVEEVISTPDPKRAHDLLWKYGVDYVLIADPPGTYLDRMPPNGIRSYLRFGEDLDGSLFTLAHTTEDEQGLTLDERTTTNGLRLYRVTRGARVVE